MTETIGISANLTPEIHEKFKEISEKNKRSMRATLELLVEKYVEDNTQPDAGK